MAEKKADKPTLADVPKMRKKSLRPKEIKFDTWEDLLKWEPGAREDDPINRSSVELAKRHRGQLVNEKSKQKSQGSGASKHQLKGQRPRFCWWRRIQGLCF